MRGLLLLGLAVAVGVAGFAQDRVVYSSGAPGFALDTSNPDPADPGVLRFGFISGSTTQGGSYPERWTATPFHLMQADTVNAIEFAWYYGSPAATTAGWKIYRADGPDGSPGTVVGQGTGVNLGSLYPARHVYPNGYLVENLGRISISSTSLSAGDYWLTVYGQNGEIMWYAGAPGGLGLDHNYRRTTSGSDWEAFAVDPGDTRMPNYGLSGLYATGYPAAGPDPNDIHQCAFRLLNVGGGGTYLTGTVEMLGWGYGPAIALPDGTPTVYELRLIDPATGVETNVFTFAVDGSGDFQVGPVKAGTYDVVVKPMSTYVGRYGIYADDGTPISEQSQAHGFGVPFVGARLYGIGVSGSTVSLGSFTMLPGDADLSGAVDLEDLNSVLVSFGAGATGDPVDEAMRFFLDFNADRVTDLLEMNAVLTYFGATGPGG